MHPLAPEKLLAVCAAGRDQPGLDRALTLLELASPGVSRDELAELSIGERDERLLRLRAELFGEQAMGFAACPECAARVELPIDTTCFDQPIEATAGVHECETSGRRVRFRMPTTRDLLEVAAVEDDALVLRSLVERCLLQDQAGAGRGAPIGHQLVETLAHAMLVADPRAETTLELACPECGHRWSLLFEVADFLWNELAAQARRLLQEVDAIARTYGWSERDILNLPAWRRRSYVELITG